MIEAISFYDYLSLGPQGELCNRLTQGQAMLDYRIKLCYDDDIRWIRLEATKATDPSVKFVQLISTGAISCITIGSDRVAEEVKPVVAKPKWSSKAEKSETA